MSRWTDAFNSNAFLSEFKSYGEALNLLDVSRVTNSDVLRELARLRKIYKHTENLLRLIDPELNPENVLSGANTHLTNSRKSFDVFSQSLDNLSQITQANNQFDSCVNIIRTLQTLLPTTTKKSLVSMVVAYEKTISDSLAKINLALVQNDAEEINKLKQVLIDGDDSVKTNVEAMAAEITEQHLKIQALYDDLLVGTDDIPSTRAASVEYIQDINEIYIQAKKASASLKEV